MTVRSKQPKEIQNRNRVDPTAMTQIQRTSQLCKATIIMIPEGTVYENQRQKMAYACPIIKAQIVPQLDLVSELGAKILKNHMTIQVTKGTVEVVIKSTR